MKNIKFRAWATITKVMIDPETIFNNFKGYAENKNYLMLQYTGINDRNGVEIFEGDILKVTDGADLIDDLDSDTGYGVVEWFADYGFWNVSHLENGIGDLNENGYLEVIGNIYENPELISSIEKE